MITLFCSFVNVVTILILIPPSISEIWERYAALTFASDGLIGCSPEAGKFFVRRRSAILALSNVQAFYALSPGGHVRLFSPVFFIRRSARGSGEERILTRWIKAGRPCGRAGTRGWAASCFCSLITCTGGVTRSAKCTLDADPAFRAWIYPTVRRGLMVSNAPADNGMQPVNIQCAEPPVSGADVTKSCKERTNRADLLPFHQGVMSR